MSARPCDVCGDLIAAGWIQDLKTGRVYCPDCLQKCGDEDRKEIAELEKIYRGESK